MTAPRIPGEIGPMTPSRSERDPTIDGHILSVMLRLAQLPVIEFDSTEDQQRAEEASRWWSGLNDKDRQLYRARLYGNRLNKHI